MIDQLVVERLKEEYLLCLDSEDPNDAVHFGPSILSTLRYFMIYADFKDFINEVRSAGYQVKDIV